jgi:hypothetical protein
LRAQLLFAAMYTLRLSLRARIHKLQRPSGPAPAAAPSKERELL